MAALSIETPESKAALTEFIRFYDQVYEYRNARWPADLDWQLSILTAQSPFAEEQIMRPLVVREGSGILARTLAVVNERYNHHWQDRLGHVCWFEALPDTRQATKLLLDEACQWLQSQGVRGARAGFDRHDHPFAIDDYDSLPPRVLRHNPAYYHSLLREAGFEAEKGFVDYKIKVRPELAARWQSALEAAGRAGYEILPLREIPPDLCVPDFTATFNDAFKAHWGWTPMTEEEMAYLLRILRPLGTLDTSVIAYRDGEPVGMLFVTPAHTSEVILKPGRTLKDSEKLNVLAIGVCEPARGQGVNLAMAGYGFLELVRRGAKYLSYTLVVDDNWPSRRTAEKLGAYICANYLVYRRNFHQRG